MMNIYACWYEDEDEREIKASSPDQAAEIYAEYLYYNSDGYQWMKDGLNIFVLDGKETLSFFVSVDFSVNFNDYQNNDIKNEKDQKAF